ncbi:hypothetical protein EZ449_02815 [Pedobacter frigidisoli]|uniref:DUF4221 domain-containing protein n=1 Tax=Pedobacter frigidisoli TaxID=2530455 RepID=A0A4V2MNI9_9SPHI|nr:hypothetical protein [Pedobacter frigidisoli]TCD12996.1 hypothetical protein EZ449_02815 [Pedobacter frigidisoli]
MDLTLINTKLDIIKRISKKADIKDGFTGDFIDPIWTKKSMVVFQQGNASSISIYDGHLNFSKNIKLFNKIYPYFLPSISSQAVMTNFGPNRYDFLLSVYRLDVSQNTAEFYSKSATFLRLAIDTSGNILEKTFLAPYNSFTEVKAALDDNTKDWDGPSPSFDYFNGETYVFYEFSDKLFIYDSSFRKPKEIPLMWPDYNWERSNVSFTKKGVKTDIGESMKTSFKLRFSKPFLIDLKYKDGLVFMHFIKPVKDEALPQTSIQERDFIYQTFLLIIDPKAPTNQKYIDLKDDFSPYSKIYPLDRNNIMLFGNFKKTDNYELIKIKLNDKN